VFLGIDLGTSSVKAVLIDTEGRPVAEASAPCRVDSPRPGHAEADPDDWWRAVAGAVHRLPDAGLSATRALGVAGQMHGVVVADAAGVALRPAVLWTDRRAVDVLSAFPPDTARRVDNALSPGMAGPILAWLARHEPDCMARVRWALQPKDWLRLRLTGEAAADPSDASATLLASADGEWDLPLVASLGLSADWFPAVRASAEIAGTLLPAPARELGLRPGLPIACGAGDTAAAALGSGLLHDGESQLSVGSGAQIVVMRGQRPVLSECLNSYRSASPPGLARWYVMAAMQNGGVALEWARDLLGLSWDEAYRVAFASRAAESSALFLPYLSGERTPWMAPQAHGAWVGLSLHDDRGSMMRAALLGVAFGIRAGLDALRQHGASIARLRVVGGGSVDPAWRAMLTDVLGVPLDAVACPNAAGRGAALLAGLSVGHWQAGDLARLKPDAVPLGDPAPGRTDDDYRRFLDLYRRLRP
jgi:xylulokinase